MERPSWVPAGVDIDTPNAARMYDYALGGTHNFPADRALVEQAEANMPGARQIAHDNRAFLGRVVRWLAAVGVRQFLDLGAGIPTLDNTHEVAQRAAPGSRVLYVDVDPIAVTQARSLLAGNPDVQAIQGDLRRPDDIVAHPESTLDLSRPVAVMLFAVMHFIGDDESPDALVRRLHDAVPPGSYLALSHGAPPPDRGGQADEVQRLYRRTATPLHLRTREQIESLIEPFELVEPGLVPVTEWHRDSDGETQHALLGGVARK